VSLIVTDEFAALAATVWRCTQYVSPTRARYWSTTVWFAAGVRATALSQSSPTAHTQDPGCVVVIAADGAPLAPLAPPTAPLMVVLAPLNAPTTMLPM
jgi:hypothetical protein